MSFRPLIHIPRGTARLLLYAVLLSIGVFFAATRTEVGRGVLKSQIERQFGEQFAGSLRIGHLSGNLLYRFTASNVQLLDDSGLPVIRIDSLVASPRWRRVRQRRVELGRLHLHGVRADLVRSADGQWNVSRALSPQQPADSTGRRLESVSVGDLRVIDGVLATRSDGSPSQLIRKGVLFDFENTEVTIGSASAILDWRPTDAQIDLINMSARIGDRELELVEAQGQIVYNDNTFLANQVSVRTGNSTFRFTGSLDEWDNGNNPDPQIDIDLVADPVDNTELARVLPKSPLRNPAFVTARIRGPLSAMVLEEVTVARGRSRVRVEGTVVGFPDSLDFEISVPGADIRRRDVRAVLESPGILDQTLIDSLTVSLLARGVIHDPFGRPDLKGNVFLDASGDAGRASGRVSVERAEGESWLLTSDVFAGDLRIDRILPRLEETTSLNGDISVSIRGSRLREMDLEAELSLGASTILGRPVDSLKVLAVADAGKIRAEIQAVQASSEADVRVQADISDSTRLYSLDARTVDLELGALIGDDSLRSAVTSRIESRFSFTNIDNLVGTVEISIDSSYVAVPGHHHPIAPGLIRLALTRPEAGIASMSLSGDIVSGQLDVRGDLSDLVSLTERWISDVREGRRPDSTLTAARPAAESTRRSQGSAPRGVTISGSVTTVNSETLSGLCPGGSTVATDLTAEFQVSLDASRASVRLGLGGDSLVVGPIRTDEYSGSLFVSVDQGVGLLESLTVSGSLTSSRFSTGGSGIPDLDMSLSYRDRSGRIEINGLEGVRVGPLNIAADLSLEEDRIVLIPSAVDVRAVGYDWLLAQSGPITLGAGGISFDGLVLDNVSDRQRIEVRGSISNRSSERLIVVTERVDLQQVSNVLSMRRTLGGRLDGEFILSRQEDTPVVEAQATISGLGLDERVLGDLTLSSALRPGAAEGVLDLTLRPTTIRPASGTVVQNQAKVVGTFRLPSSDVEGDRTDPGVLDLTAEIERADLFFFEYIFPGTIDEVTGYTTGSVLISGSLSRPVFDADLRIVEGSFTVPRFNLAMSLTADVQADRNGIHIRRADVIDKTDGSVILTGDILFNDYKFFSFNLDGRLDRFQIMDVASSRDLPFYGHIWASGTTTLTGPLNQTQLRATSARSSPDSELFIPLVESQESSDAGFIVFADSTGEIPDLTTLTRRRNLLASRPSGERGFTEGMDMELNIEAPEGSTVHLVIDPLLGDVINGVGSGRVQILRREGQFETFGSFQVNSGDYLFTAGEVFVRRFIIEEGGQIVWDGDPADARLDIPAAFRTRASRAGLQATTEGSASLIPVVVTLRITGRVSAPEVALALNIDRSTQTIGNTSDQEFLETILNNPQLSTEYATSVLLTNSFALTTSGTSGTDALGSGAFNSLSQLIAAQLNRYLSSALPNVDFSFGVQGQTSQELDITYGVALRLLDERLVIRGQGVYQGTEASTAESLQGEFMVEVRLSSKVSVEVFYRREGDLLVRTLTSTTGAGLSYRTEFPTWKRFLHRLFGWMLPGKEPEPPDTVTANSSGR